MGLLLLAARRTGLVSKVAPEQIIESALDAAHLDVPEAAQNAASTISHIGYGAPSGALYGLLRPHLPDGAMIGGLAFAGALSRKARKRRDDR